MDPQPSQGTSAQGTSRLADLSRQVAALSNQVVAAARAADRPDLADLLTATAARWGDPQVTVVVAGEIGVGKSALVSALAGHPDLLPSGSVATTGVITTVSAIPDPNGGAGSSAEVLIDGRDEPIAIALDELSAWTGHEGERRGSVARVDVRVAEPVTGDRVVLVDTPGVAGPHTTADRLVLAVLARADVLLFVTDADAPLGRTEIDFLTRARDEVGTCVVALSRIDRFRGWSTIQADTTAILQRDLAGWAPAAVGVSTTLARVAGDLAAEGDTATGAEVAAEAGVDHLRSVVLGLAQRSKHVRLAGLLQVVRRVVASLAEPAVVADQAAQASPADLAAELERCQAEQVALRQRGTVVLAALSDEVNSLREQLSVYLRRIVGDVTIDHEERLLNPKADPDDLLDAVEHDLRAAQLRLTAEVDGALADIRESLTERLEGGGPDEEPEPLDEVGESLTRPRRATARPAKDHALRLRVAASIASAGGGTVMMGMTFASTSAGGNALRSGLMGVSMMLGGVVANTGVRQSRQQKVLQTVRAQARSIVDEWQAASLASARGRVLASQREMEAGFREAVKGRLVDLEAQAKTLHAALQADERDRRVSDQPTATTDLGEMEATADRLEQAVRAALAAAVPTPAPAAVGGAPGAGR